MFTSSSTCAERRVEIRTERRIASRSPRSGVPGRGTPLTPKIPDMITSSVIACIAGASGNGSPSGQRVDLAFGGLGDHRGVALDRLAVEGGQEQLALAHVLGSEQRQDRVRPDDRAQRRLAGQGGRKRGIGREQGAGVIGMAADDDDVVVDHAAESEHLPQLAPGAEHELDLAHAQAQGLKCSRQGQRRRQPRRCAVVGQRPGHGGRRIPDREGAGGCERRFGGGVGRGHCPLRYRPASVYSHSIVPGGFEVMSRTTRLTSRSSLIMREAICSSRS